MVRRRILLLVAAVVSTVLAVPVAADPAPGTSRRLGDSSDVVLAAVDVSQGEWADGAATTVVLGRDDVFADTLAGAALAGTAGPILFTDGGPAAALRPETLAEIERVLPEPSGCDGSSAVVNLLGGSGAVSAAVEAALVAEDWCVRRVAGANRVETAVAVAERAPDPSRVLLARSDAWFDAAAGGAYAAATGHPILVTATDRLEPAVAAFLGETQPEEIVLLGGSAALSAAVEEAAAMHAPTRRVQGATRDATAVAIAEELWTSLDPSGVVLANGFVATGWAYAIAGAVNAAVEGAPVLFAEQHDVTVASAAHLDRADPTFRIAVGPPGLVGPAVATGRAAGADWHLLAPPDDGPERYRAQVFEDVERTNGITYGSAVNRQGQTVTLQLDRYVPAGDDVTRRPAIIWVHGGGFCCGDRTSGELVDQATVFAQRGFVNVSISYRLDPGGCSAAAPSSSCVEAIRQAMDDAQTAVRFLRDNADEYGIDVDRIAIAGSSAGAITALNVGYATSENPQRAVQAAIGLSGANILGSISAGDAPALDFHGTDDDLVPYQWAADTVAGARERGLVANLTTWEGAGHVPYGEFRADIIEQTGSFLWWTLGLDAADS